MTITITMELTEQNLEKLKTLLPDAKMEVKAETKPVKKVKTQKQEQAIAEPVEQQIEEYPKDWLPQDTAYTNKVDTPEQPLVQPVQQEVTVTKEDIRAAALALAQAGKSHKVAETFAKFGASKLTDFENKTNMYPALLEELKNATPC